MIKFSDNAAPDWLPEKLGEDYFRQTIALLEMRRQETPLYLAARISILPTGVRARAATSSNAKGDFFV
ncbi:MAG: hypothetical protein M3384_10470 [Acidobacteriota bacterium]|nr:hypothetical protein [Acidobacteriota bacterium]